MAPWQPRESQFRGAMMAAPAALSMFAQGSAGEAIDEIKSLLCSRTDGRVWVENWRERYSALARTPREFMENHPLVFEVHPTGRSSYTVSLVGDVLRRTPAAPAASRADGAIQEITTQLIRRGDGKIWIDDWRERYGMLGPTPKAFMETRPDLFALQYDGNRYTVALVDGALEGGGEAFLGEQDPFDPIPELEAIDDEQAVQEISVFVARSRDGRVWIPDWKPRYGHLARTPREFMETHPEVFDVQANGNRWTVSLVGQEVERSPFSYPRDGGMKRPYGKGFEEDVGPSAAKVPRTQQCKEDMEADALVEIYVQLGNPESNGRVWIDNWRQRFSDLANTPRGFIEAHPDKFQIIPGRGNSYSVQVIDALV